MRIFTPAFRVSTSPKLICAAVAGCFVAVSAVMAAPVETAPPKTVPKAVEQATVETQAQDNIGKDALAALNALYATVLPEITDYEKQRIALVEQGINSKSDKDGVFAELKGHNMAYISLRQAVVMGLEKNLDLMIAQATRESATQVVQEAKAAFDPVISASLGYSQSDTTTRYRTGHVNLKNFNPAPLNGIPTGGKTPAVNDIIYRTQASATGVEDVVYASNDPTYHPDREYTFTASVSQALPSGQTFSLGTTTRKKRIYYRDGYYYKNGQFTTDLSLNVASPLPGTKNFGEYSAGNVNKKAAKISDKRAEWVLRSTVNSVMYNVASSYWNLVASLENLHSAQANMGKLSEQRARMRRLFNVRQSTAFEKNQMEAEYEKAAIKLEQARENYVLASKTLAEQLDNGQDNLRNAVFLPYGFSKLYNKQMPVNYASARKTAMTYHPDIHAANYNMDLDMLSAHAAKNQSRPDLAFNASITNSQSNAAYGYKDFRQSLFNTFDPDTNTQVYTLSFNRPWGNVAANAARDKAALGVDLRGLVNSDVNATIEKSLADAVAAYDAARRTVKLAQNEQKRVQDAYNGLVRQQTAGANVSENEVILTSRRVLAAQNRLATSRVNVKTAELGLLAAQGILPVKFSEHTKISDFDAKRLEQLAADGQIPYFSWPETKDDESAPAP